MDFGFLLLWLLFFFSVHMCSRSKLDSSCFNSFCSLRVFLSLSIYIYTFSLLL